MAFVVKDRVKETCTSPGTGTVTLLGASTGYVSFSVVGNGNSTYYCIATQGGNDWEVGIGTYTSAGTTLSRDTVLSNSAGTTAKINFSTGTQDVFVTYPSERAVTAVGGGLGAVILASNTVTEDCTVDTGFNAVTPGPVTVAGGVSVTVASGSVWTVI